MGRPRVVAQAQRRGSHFLVFAAIGLGALTLSGCLGSTPGGGSNGATVSQSTGATLDQQLLNAGLAQFSAHQYKAAIEDLNAAYEINGAGYQVKYVSQFDLGVLYVETGQYPEAITAFKRSLSVNPNYAFALNNLAIIEASKDPKYAITLYQRLLKDNPGDRSAVYTDLGNLYIQTGNTAKGQQDLTIAESLAATKAQLPSTSAPPSTTVPPSSTTASGTS